MQKLAPPDSHFLSAAIGWLELGNIQEAREELNHISAPHRDHPDVLEIYWLIASNGNCWEECCAVARSLIRVAPKRASGWIHLSYALHEMKRSQEAYDNLVSVAGKYPRNHLIRYNLACYACQLGREDEALKWLKKAMALGDEHQLIGTALNDPDLQPMREQIQSMKF
jgi:tetratricopeptide (TPR) repeat protein